MLDFLVALADEVGFPRERIIVVHCDLGRVEWAGTRALAQEQAEHYGLRFEVVSRDLGDLLVQVEQRHASNQARGKDNTPWPGFGTRWCTADQKTGQVHKLITRLVDELNLPRQARILNCLGLRAEESFSRAQAAVFSVEKKPTNGRRLVHRWLPIHGWSEAAVWARIHASGVRHHPAYDLGMTRLSCVFCPLASREDNATAVRHNLALAAEYIAVEQRVGYAFREDGLSVAALVEGMNDVTQFTSA
jgi:3'-phosphoadenosine 5'-phosphosulfate sulfotransferase (PAPS reductase)/FAD synthetase